MTRTSQYSLILPEVKPRDSRNTQAGPTRDQVGMKWSGKISWRRCLQSAFKKMSRNKAHVELGRVRLDRWSFPPEESGAQGHGTRRNCQWFSSVGVDGESSEGSVGRGQSLQRRMCSVWCLHFILSAVGGTQEGGLCDHIHIQNHNCGRTAGEASELKWRNFL